MKNNLYNMICIILFIFVLCLTVRYEVSHWTENVITRYYYWKEWLPGIILFCVFIYFFLKIKK